jgi:RsiW-degrading membrane proteinase PrsW (M82 family)
MNHLLVSTLLLLTAVSFGGYLTFVGVRQHKRLPKLGIAHGVLALSGIIVLALQIAAGPSDKLNNIAVFFLLLALAGGTMVFLLHEKGEPPSMPVVIIHAVMGVIGVSLLVMNL